MIGFLTNVAPIALGFVAKLFALKSQAAQEQQKLMIQSLQVRNDSINMARDRADKESPVAAMNRRIIYSSYTSFNYLYTDSSCVFQCTYSNTYCYRRC